MQNDNNSTIQFATDVPDNVFDDQSARKEKTQQMVQFNVHPGFLCFFEGYVEKKGWTFYECYQKVFHSHHEIMKVKRPVQAIFDDKSKNLQQKVTEIVSRSQKGKKFAWFTSDQQTAQLQCLAIDNYGPWQESILKLKEDLKKVEKIREQVIKQKKKEFIQKQINRQKEYQKMLKQEFNEKERRAHLVYQIEREARQKQKARQLRKQQQRAKIAESEAGFKEKSSSCQIM